MTKEELIEQCKYYNGEEECPYEDGSNGALWWNGEKCLLDSISCDENFFYRLVDLYKEALASGDCSGALVDQSFPIEKRVILFYLDLWHGKNFPYDGLDVINQY